MKETPKITVITITLNLFKDNRQDLFRQCVESVKNQTYKNIEYIVQDGASKDGTVDLIKEYEKQGLLKLYSEPDKGIDDAYNHALKHATGKYIIFMNSDDCFYDDKAIEESVKKLEEEQADYSYGKEKKVDRDGKFVMLWEPKVENFWKNMPFSHQTLFVKKSVMDELGGYNTDCGFGGDVYLVLQLILNDYKGVEVDHIISLYRIGGISSQTDDKKGQMKVLYVLAKRFLYLYKQFYEDINLEQVEDIYYFGDNPAVYPKYFLQRLIRFMVEKNLKNFDYNKFINFVNFIASGGMINSNLNCSNIHNRKNIISYKLFNLLPLMTIKQKNNKTYYKLFGIIPLFYVKKILAVLFPIYIYIYCNFLNGLV